MQGNMQSLTGKELQYIGDSMTNEDLLMKQCIAISTHATTPQFRQICTDLSTRHMQRYDHLLQVLEEHAHITPGSYQ